MNTDKDLEIVNLKQRLSEAERQRDAAKRDVSDCIARENELHIFYGKVEAERDQLIKVVDELEKYKGIAIYCHGGQLALKDYSLLPHVKQKKHE